MNKLAKVKRATDDDPHVSRPHAETAEGVLAALGGNPKGLDADEAKQRLDKVGPNRLPAPPGRNPVLRFLAQFHNVLIYVLLVAAGITALLEHWVDTGVILAVVLVNAIIGFIQEGKAEKAMAALRDMLAPRATVLRDGVRHGVEAADIVPGDIVLLEAGDRVPADLRVLSARGLGVAEAVLTGEAVPVQKTADPVEPAAALGDRSSMLYSGTLVTSGTGRGVAVATGTATEIGRISGMLADVERLTTPLVRQMDQFGRWLTVFILLVAGLLLVWGHFIGQMDFAELFMAVVGLSVAAIPEGLPAVLTITLAIGVQAMARRNAIVRRLPAIETLGAVSVICSDKTGTLTRNEMVAAALATVAGPFTVDGDGYAPEGSLASEDEAATDPDSRADLRAAARVAALCNDAVLRQKDDGWHAEGDPMEGALLTLAGRVMGGDPEAFSAWQRRDVIPFDSAHRYMAVLDEGPEGGTAIHVKGAPEAIFALCRGAMDAEGGTVDLDTDAWHRAVETLAAEGQRVIALAVADAEGDARALEPEMLEGGLILVGLVGLIDPPRPEAIAAVAECHEAGIAVKMITGDHAATASAIAAMIGLDRTENVLTGADIDAMDDRDLADAVIATDVFARTSPEHKLRLVMALQSQGLVVAMTGDGVNDAPALKRADAGIAMGLKGSETAKESAALVLADDNFASIAAAVREGRTVYDNIRKVVSWTLPTNAGEAATIVLALALGTALPMLPVHILWTNMITAVTLGIALAFEPTEPDTMRRPPRGSDEPLLTGGLIWQIILVSTLYLAGIYGMFVYALDKGHPLPVAQSMALNTLVILKVFYLFYTRNLYGTSLRWSAVKGTPVVWGCVMVMTAAQFAITYLPPLQGIFRTAAIPLEDGVLLVAVGVVFFLLMETEKQMRLALRGSQRSNARAVEPELTYRHIVPRRRPPGQGGPQRL